MNETTTQTPVSKSDMTLNEKNSVPSPDAGEHPNGGQNRKKIIQWGIAGMVILAMIVLIPYIHHAMSYESTDDAFIDGDIVPVSPRVSGYVKTIHVKDNQWVKAGDLLVELDPRDFEVRMDTARAMFESVEAAGRVRDIEVELTTINTAADLENTQESVEMEKAALQEAVARLTRARAMLEQIKADADSAEVKHRRDAVDLDRYKTMAKAGMVSQQDLDHAESAEQISAAALIAARKRIDTQKAVVREVEAALKAGEARLHQSEARLVAARSAPKQVEKSRFQAKVSGSEINRAKAEMAMAALNLSYTKMYAPCDGFVTKKSVEKGQFVQVGQSTMAIVSRDVWVTANFKETQITHICPGQPVNIAVDTYPGLTLHGYVDSIQRGTGAIFSLLPPENATGNFVKVTQRVPVKIIFDRQKKDFSSIVLSPGMTVVPDVDIRAEGNADHSEKHIAPSENKGADTTT